MQARECHSNRKETRSKKAKGYMKSKYTIQAINVVECDGHRLKAVHSFVDNPVGCDANPNVNDYEVYLTHST